MDDMPAHCVEIKAAFVVLMHPVCLSIKQLETIVYISLSEIYVCKPTYLPTYTNIYYVYIYKTQQLMIFNVGTQEHRQLIQSDVAENHLVELRCSYLPTYLPTY